MIDLYKHIETAELKWLNSLSEYCEKLFKQNNIPSHDHTHHIRVWEYSKDIILTIKDFHKIEYNLVESCLIASLFHDVGLTKTLDENHGKESKNICISYFKENNIKKPKNFDDILFAIENHDDKDYKLNTKTPDSLYSIICNADDLDAYGKIGIIRYTEIYLLRGINLNNLPKSVIKNLDKRFSNFEQTYKAYPNLFNKHKKRYLTTRKFFEELISETT